MAEKDERWKRMCKIFGDKLNATFAPGVPASHAEVAQVIRQALSEIDEPLGPSDLQYFEVRRDDRTDLFTVTAEDVPAGAAVQWLSAEGALVCDPEIYNWGEHIFTVTGTTTHNIEAWVKRVAERSGQRVDWNNYNNCAHVKVLGDRAKARQAIEELLSELHRVGGYGSDVSLVHDLPWTLL